MSPHNPKHIDAQMLIGAKTIGMSVLESKKSLQEHSHVLNESQVSLNQINFDQNGPNQNSYFKFKTNTRLTENTIGESHRV